jgi:hypothetical protein
LSGLRARFRYPGLRGRAGDGQAPKQRRWKDCVNSHSPAADVPATLSREPLAGQSQSKSFPQQSHRRPELRQTSRTLSVPGSADYRTKGARASETVRLARGRRLDHRPVSRCVAHS